MTCHSSIDMSCAKTKYNALGKKQLKEQMTFRNACFRSLFGKRQDYWKHSSWSWYDPVEVEIMYCSPKAKLRSRIQYSETLGFEQFIFIGAGNNDTVALLPPPSFWNDSSFDDCTTCWNLMWCARPKSDWKWTKLLRTYTWRIDEENEMSWQQVAAWR